MAEHREPWALVLAAGEGTRLRALTTGNDGRPIPKQFCSLTGGESLLGAALRRAGRITHCERITAVVAEHHQPWWSRQLTAIPERNVIAQPSNRGTAVGVLLPLLRILRRDPEARLVLLPSDHFVAEEAILERAMRGALEAVRRDPDRIALLGIVPDEPDSGLGWIVPDRRAHRGARPVVRFVEKPPAPLAAELMRAGAVWNSFIVAAAGRTLLRLFEERLPDTVRALREALPADGKPAAPGALGRAYAGLASRDFSRDLLEGAEARLVVQDVSACGWSDLGTPERVARCIDSHPARDLQARSPAGEVWRLDVARGRDARSSIAAG